MDVERLVRINVKKFWIATEQLKSFKNEKLEISFKFSIINLKLYINTLICAICSIFNYTIFYFVLIFAISMVFLF